MKKIIHKLGGHIVSEWQPSCTHLVMSSVKVTVKVTVLLFLKFFAYIISHVFIAIILSIVVVIIIIIFFFALPRPHLRNISRLI